MIRVLTRLFALLLLVPSSSLAADWPQFRGPERDGISTETGLIVSWPESGLAEHWRVPLGEGFSGISVVDGSLYTMAARDDSEYLVAFDAATGRERFAVVVDKKFRDRFGHGPRCTPTVKDGRVFGVSAGGKLVALAASDGKKLWARDLVAELGAEIPTWGISGSPIVVADKLLVEVGGKSPHGVVALRPETGETIWSADTGPAGYSAPIVVEIDGREQAIFFSQTGLVALGVDDGKRLWDFPWKTSYGVNAATPIFLPPNRLFASTGYDHGAAVLEIESAEGKFSVEEIWDTRMMRNKFSSSVVVDGWLYGFDEKLLKCIDIETGERRWQKKGYGHGSLVFADGHLVILSDRGKLALVEASPEGFREAGAMQVFDSKTWTVPTLVDGRLYLRDEKELVSLQLGAETETSRSEGGE